MIDIELLNPNKFVELALSITEEKNNIEKHIKKQENVIVDAKKKMRKAIFGFLITFTILVFTCVTAFYPPIREMVFNILNIDSAKAFDFAQMDCWKLVFIYLLLVIVDVIALCVVEEDKDSIGIAIFTVGLFPLVAGPYFCISDIKYQANKRKEAIAQLVGLENSLQKIDKDLHTTEEKRLAEIKLLKETDEIYELGIVKNDISLIEKAAALGNSKAIKYLDYKEGERLYNLAKHGGISNFELLEKASELGNVFAIVEVAEILIGKANSDTLTNNEKNKLQERVVALLKDVDFREYPDGRVLQIEHTLDNQLNLSRKYIYEEMLEEVRILKRQKKLSSKYEEKANEVIKKIIDIIDFEAKPMTCSIDDPVQFMKDVEKDIDKKLGIKPLDDTDGAFVPIIDVTDV